MPDTSVEARIRASLRGGVDGEPFTPVAPPIVARARRRLLRNAIAASLLGIVVLAGVLASVGALRSPVAPNPGNGNSGAYVPPPEPTCCLPPTASLLYMAADDTARWTAPEAGSGIVSYSRPAIAVGRDGSIAEQTSDGDLDIYLGGHAWVPLTSVGTVTGAAIRPDGRQIAYTTADGLFVGRIPDTAGFPSPARLLVRTRARESFSSPTWSPDGARLAFVSTLNSVDTLEMYEVDRQHVSTWRDGVASASWSPSGDTIAAFGQGGTGLLLIDGSTGSTQTLDGSATSPTAPAWSPDGSQLAYLTPQGNATIVGKDGTHLSDVPLLDVAPDSPLFWSPGASAP